MSPFKKPVILDNDIISRLYSAGALRRALEIWPKHTFYVTRQVIGEARKWPAKGADLSALLKELLANETLGLTSINDSSEEEIWAYAELLLQNKLGRGESASIAIAHHRGFDIATDDEIAQDICKAFYFHFRNRKRTKHGCSGPAYYSGRSRLYSSSNTSQKQAIGRAIESFPLP